MAIPSHSPTMQSHERPPAASMSSHGPGLTRAGRVVATLLFAAGAALAGCARSDDATTRGDKVRTVRSADTTDGGDDGGGPAWQLNGNATATTAGFQLTAATDYDAAGSVFWTSPYPSTSLRVEFDATIDGGTGADGMTLAFLDPSAGPTALGWAGGGLGFQGLRGIAIALDTFQNGGDPSANFIGIGNGLRNTVTPGGAVQYETTSVQVPTLRGAPHHVQVTVKAGLLTANVDGVAAISAQVALPPQVLVGFTGATGGLSDRHEVDNISIATSWPPPADAGAPPLASAGADQHATCASTVTLDATGSSDPAGKPVTYAWSQTAGPLVDFSGWGAVQPWFIAPQVSVPTPLVFNVVVSNATASSAPATVTVTVSPPPSRGADMTASGSIISLVTAPQGQGSRNLEIIRDGVYPPLWSTDTSQQYDTWTGTARPEDWIGYQFNSPQLFGEVVYQGGVQAGNGGWFNDLGVQVRQNGTWVNVPGLAFSPWYNGNDFVNFETYTIDFPAIAGDAIRIDGQPGGYDTFISVGELRVFAGSAAAAAAPTAAAGPAQSAMSLTLATLDGSRSSDPAGNGLSYAWTQTAGPTVPLSDGTAVNPSFTVPMVSAPTPLVFSLIVGNGAVASSPSTVTVTATPRPHPGPDLTANATLIALVTAQNGNTNPEVIRDGVYPPIGSGDLSTEYISYTGQQQPEAWIGYAFASPQTFGELELQNGIQFWDGGWFTSVKVQVQRSGAWVDVPGVRVTPPYPGNDGINFETYTFDFPAIRGDAIRIDGTPGGQNTFITVGEMHVYAAPVDGSGNVVCAPLDTCHVPGSFDSSAGQCSNPNATDGTACAYLRDCSTGDACQSGVCSGTPFTSTSTTCGVGACLATGVTSCGAGTVLNSCVPGTPAADDTTCDGIDDNCNGQIDEGYVPVPTSCGVGACAAMGQTSCVAGHVVDSCTPGTPAPNDATCDGIDDNCNGQIDEDYVPASTVCGLGVCKATGATSCVSGSVQDSCTPGTPTGDDSNCNGIDENCNGQADENFQAHPTTCGIGACTATGSAVCTNATVIDTCKPKTPPPGDTSCTASDGGVDTIWQVNGNASATSTGFQLTTADNDEVGSVFSTNPYASGSIRVEFDETIDSGNGADGLTLAFVDPMAGPTALGAPGGGLGFSGLPGLAVTFDTHQNWGDPSNNFVGITDGPTAVASDAFHYLATTTNVPALFGATHHVRIALQQGLLLVNVDGAVAIAAQVTLPPQVLVGFTAATGGANDRHAVDNISIATSWSPAADAGAPPLASAGADQNATCASTVTLDGSASMDPSGAPFVYAWGQVSGPKVLFSDPTVAQPTFLAPQVSAPTPLVFTLIVADATAASAPATVTVTVSPPPNRGPDLTATGSIIALVTDPQGQGSRDLEVIRDGVYPPILSIDRSKQYDTFTGTTRPEDWIGYVYNTQQTFGEVVYQDGVLDWGGGFFYALHVQVRQNGNWINVPGVISTPQFPGNDWTNFETFTLDFPAISGDAIRLDGPPGGSNAYISVGELRVFAGSTGGTAPPTAAAGPDQSVLALTLAQLDGTASTDPAGAPLSYAWTQLSGPPVALSDVTSPTPQFTAPAVSAPTTLVFNLTVANGTAASSQSSVTVTVTPRAHPGSDLTASATIIALITQPTGGGNKDLEVIRDGIYPPIGSWDGSQGYDTFAGASPGRTEDWIGYAYASPQTFAQIEFQGGIQFWDGGWFTAVKVQVEQGGTWVDVPGVTVTPPYAGNDGINYETYDFNFPPITGDAIRIDGTPGGANTFISVGEMHVYGTGSSNGDGGTGPCAPQDSCHLAGTANPSTGQCTNPVAPDGTPCDDQNACTSTDACTAGVCKGSAFVPVTTQCGVGACAATGVTSCTNGVVQNSCTPGIPAADDATCNGVDDNCNGIIDEGYISVPTSCGVGACAAVGHTSCVAGVVQNSCVPGAPLSPNDATCNGIDDNCNGIIDENYVSAATTCGVGACHASGSTSCVAGQVQDSCTPGTPAANDATCNGIDDNCNGLVDENYKPHATSCGVGACASTGTTACSNGVESDSCHPGTPAANDTTCDGIDDNCNGQVDEGYVSVATNCGVGACTAKGKTSCVSGHVDDSCQPGAPAPSDTTCNGIDDNCNGQVDEGYVSVATNCGTGACAATGQSSCVSGTVQQNCTAKPPTSSTDTTCDGIDDNCNGQVDEGYVPVATTCGVGACAATGQTSCVSGRTQDSCHPGTPAASDKTCNGVDDDCNGQVDDGFVPTCAGGSVVTCVSGTQQLHNCSDGNPCNGQESCSAGSCVSGTPPQIDDGNACTIDKCDPSAGVTHTPAPAGTSCGPSQVCDSNGVCYGPPFIIADLTDQTVPLGGTLTFIIQAGGTQLSYQWMLAGSPISGATSATYTKPNITATDDQTTYSVVITNPAGSVTSRTAKVTVGNAGPTLVVNSVGNPSITADSITLSGTATPAGSPIDHVFVTSDRYPAPQAFAASYDASTNAFAVDVPLKPGVNNLIVVARDRQGATAQSPIAITETLTATPALAITSPVCGSVVGTDTVTVSGTAASTLQPNQIRLTLGGNVRFPTDPGNGNPYVFSFPGVHLVPGVNTLLLQATIPDGSVTSQTCVLTRVDGSDGGVSVVTGAPPQISVVGAASDVYVSTTSVSVAGTVTATRCVSSVTVNGQPATVVGSGPSVTFQSTVVFAGANSVTLPVTVAALDCDGLSAQLTYTLHLDAVGPVISVQNLQPAPAINSSVQTPYTVQGTVTDSNLGSLTANGQSLSAVPDVNAGAWDFSFNAALVRGVDNPVSIVATDLAGNSARFDAILRLTATVGIQIVSPADGAQLVTDGAPVSVGVVAQVTGLGATDSVLAAVDSGPASPLTLAGGTATGTVSVGATTGAHTITITGKGADGTLLGQVTRTVTVTLSQNIPVVVTRTDPPNGGTGVETTQFVALYFNREIDPTQLTVSLTETVHGQQYVTPPAGADITQLNGVKLAQLDRDHDPVPGGLGFFPGNVMVAYYPTREFGYGANINVTATYNGKPLNQFAFTTRPLPTLISGFVADQFHTPIQGLDVFLEDVGVHSTTDLHGYFSFGFGNFAEAIPAGVHRVVVNAGLANMRYGAVRLRVAPQDGRYTYMGVVHAPLLNPATPFVHIGSGAATATLAGGAVVLNLSAATLQFPDGRGDGNVHVQAYLGTAVTYPVASQSLFPLLAFGIQPAGILVSGTATVDIALPPTTGAKDWTQSLPPRVILLGIDPNMMQLVPIGVGVVDKAARRVRSEGVLALQGLDYIGIAAPLGPNAQTLLATYAAGGVSILDIVSRLQGQ